MRGNQGSLPYSYDYLVQYTVAREGIYILLIAFFLIIEGLPPRTPQMSKAVFRKKTAKNLFFPFISVVIFLFST